MADDVYSDGYLDTYSVVTDAGVVDDSYVDSYGDGYGTVTTAVVIDVEYVTFESLAEDLLDGEVDAIGGSTADLTATGALTAAPDIETPGTDSDAGSVTLTATGDLTLTTQPTIQGTSVSQDITVTVTFTATGYSYMEPNRLRSNPGRLLVTTPTTAIRQALEAAQVKVWRVVDILNADETIWQSEATVQGGKVAIDLSRDERRTLDLTLANPDDLYAPTPEGFWYDKILRVRRGVELDGYRYEFDLGFFMIDQISPGHLNATISVSGRDYTKKMMKSHLEAAVTFKQGERMEDILKAVAYNSGITRVDVPFTGLKLEKDYTFDADATRWDIVKSIATSFAYDAFFSVNGTFTIRKQQDPVTTPPVLTFGTSGRNTVSLSVSTNDGDMYNHIVVSSSSEGETLPVWASVENNEPSSPTRIARLGRRTKRIESALATTKEQCAEVAAKFLAVSGLEQFDISFSALNYPWLDVGNVVVVDNPKAAVGDPRNYLLTSLNIPIELGPMTGQCKRVTIVGKTTETGGGGTKDLAILWGDEGAVA